MGILSRLANSLAKDDDFKRAAKERKIQRLIEQREKSNAERVLERIQEEEKQKKIKAELEKITTQRRKELFSGGMSPERNVFHGHKNILTEDKRMLDSSNMFFS